MSVETRIRTRERNRGERRSLFRDPRVPVAIALALVLAFAGGSSRPDALQLLILRPTVVILGTALVLLPTANWQQYRTLLMLLGLFAATMVLQLVPLPPAVWHAIPGHARFNLVLDSFGASTIWRPLTLSTDGTLNALIALTVPFVTLAVMTQLSADLRSKALETILLLGALSMALGVAQIAGSSTSSLYFYEVDANDQLVGLFANRNHQGAMLAMILPLLRAWTLMPNRSRLNSRLRGFVAAAAGAVVLAYILVLGSRAGLVLAPIGLLGAFLIKPQFSSPRGWRWQQWAIVLGVVVALGSIFAVVSFADRSATTHRIASMQGLDAEGRIEVLPVLLRIVADVWPFGTGYGSFVPVFASYEPDAMLTPLYWNNAHNDPLEILITGGVPGVLALVAFLIWWLRSSYRALAGGRDIGPRQLLARSAVFATLILMLASLVDYPVRTPLLSGVFTLLCCFLVGGGSQSGETRDPRRRSSI